MNYDLDVSILIDYACLMGFCIIHCHKRALKHNNIHLRRNIIYCSIKLKGHRGLCWGPWGKHLFGGSISVSKHSHRQPPVWSLLVEDFVLLWLWHRWSPSPVSENLDVLYWVLGAWVSQSWPWLKIYLNNMNKLIFPKITPYPFYKMYFYNLKMSQVFTLF